MMISGKDTGISKFETFSLGRLSFDEEKDPASKFKMRERSLGSYRLTHRPTDSVSVKYVFFFKTFRVHKNKDRDLSKADGI